MDGAGDLLSEVERSGWCQAVGALLDHEVDRVDRDRPAALVQRGVEVVTRLLHQLQRGEKLKDVVPFDRATIDVLIQRDPGLSLLQTSMTRLDVGDRPDAVQRDALQAVMTVPAPPLAEPKAPAHPPPRQIPSRHGDDELLYTLQQVAGDAVHEHDHLLAQLEDDSGAVVRISTELVRRLARGELPADVALELSALDLPKVLSADGVPALREILETIGRRAQLPTFSGRRYWPLRHPALWVGSVWIEVLPRGHAAGTITQRCAIVWGEWGVEVAQPLRPGERLIVQHQKDDPNDWPLLVARAARGSGYGRAGRASITRGRPVGACRR